MLALFFSSFLFLLWHREELSVMRVTSNDVKHIKRQVFLLSCWAALFLQELAFFSHPLIVMHSVFSQTSCLAVF